MRKLFIPIAIVAMIFTSCKKYEASEPLDLESLPKVTLTGTVYADLDETNATLEFAPTGTVVRVSVPYANYDLANESNGNYIQTTTIGAEGKYSISIPVVTSGVTATISFGDFTYDVKTLNAVGQTTTMLKHFALLDVVRGNLGSGNGEGSYITIDAQYANDETNPNDSNTVVPTTTVTVSGKLEYQADDTTLRSVPADTKILATVTLTDAGGREYKELQTITVGAAGTYSIRVPMVDRGVAEVELSAENFWEFMDIYNGNKRAIYRYELTATIGGIYNYATQAKKDFVYTQGAKINDVE